MSSTEGRRGGRRRVAVAVVAVLAGAVGCIRLDMYDQPRYEPLEASPFFDNGRSSRELPKGTVARGTLHEDAFYYRGMEDTAFARHYPMPVTRDVLKRGQQRFNIYCTPCHDPTGHGHGMVVRRGFKQPTDYHIDRLRQAPPGYFFDVITNGYGQMNGYAAQVSIPDRWAIVAYIRALQLSQGAKLADLPAGERAQAEEELRKPPPAPGDTPQSTEHHGGH